MTQIRQTVANPVSRIRKARARRSRQRREGLIVLLLMLVLVMASSTAIFTVQSTQYEQRSASAVGEANWARGLAECAAMAGIAYAEDPLASKNPPTLGAQWVAAGSTPALYTRKYAIPEPLLATPPGTPAPNRSGSQPLLDETGITAPAASNVPTGSLAVFLPPNDRSTASPTYPLFANYDSQFVPAPGLRFYRAHWLQEVLTLETSGQKGNSGTVGLPRTRTVVTGFAEINVWNDPTDASNVRGLHELDTISRGYIDIIQ